MKVEKKNFAREGMTLHPLEKAEQLDRDESKEALESPYCTVDEAASYLRLSVSKVYKLIHLKQISYRKHGSRVVFHRDDLDKWSASSKVDVVESDFLLPGLFAIKERRRATAKKRSLKTKNMHQRG